MRLNEELTPEEQKLIDGIRRYLDQIEAAPGFGKAGWGNPVDKYLRQALDNVSSLTHHIKDPKAAEANIKYKLKRKEDIRSRKEAVVKIVADLKMPKLLTVTQEYVYFVQPSGKTYSINTDLFNDNADRRCRVIKAFVNDIGDYSALTEEMQWMTSAGFKTSKLIAPSERAVVLPFWCVSGVSIKYAGPILNLRTLSVEQTGTDQAYELAIRNEDGTTKSYELDEWTHAHIEELLATISSVRLAAVNIHSAIGQCEAVGRDLVDYRIKMNSNIFSGATSLPETSLPEISIQSDEITGGVQSVLRLMRERFTEKIRDAQD